MEFKVYYTHNEREAFQMRQLLRLHSLPRNYIRQRPPLLYYQFLNFYLRVCEPGLRLCGKNKEREIFHVNIFCT